MRFLETVREDGSLRVQTVNDEAEVTRQSFKDECDINHILRQYKVTGVVRHLNMAQAQFLDVSGVPSYDEALQVVENAQAMFMELPAAARKVFGNSPAKFLDAAHDPAQRDLLEQAGLIPAEKPEDRVITPSEPSPKGEGGEA